MKASRVGVLGGSLVALFLVGCGGGGDGGSGTSASTDTGSGTTAGSSTGSTTATTASTFSRSGSWVVSVPAAGASVCYDFDAAAEVAGCDGTAWDIKLTAGARGNALFTNSGTSGAGKAGVYSGAGKGMMSWDALRQWTDARNDPTTGAVLPERIYFPDGATGAFEGDNAIGSAAFEYGLGGQSDHLLYPSYRVFLISTDASSTSAIGTAQAPVFALQITGYYGTASGTVSGHPSFRWLDRRTPDAVREASVDATQGWVYFDLITGTTSSESGTWHIAFNRYRVKLNGGASGSGNVGGVVGLTNTQLYTAEGAPITAALMSAKPEQFLADMTSASLPADTVSAWQMDGLGSRLTPASTRKADGSFDFGWYTYYPSAALAAAAGLPATAHTLGANTTQGMMVRSAEGNSYARMRLSKIEYQDSANPRSAQTWTFEYDLQPAAN